jgi:hypothetical protein
VSPIIEAGSERARRALEEISRAGSCAHPIRIAVLREGVPAEDHVILVACKDRRAALCPACAHTYKGDAWQVVASGLRGGKGVPAEVGMRPRVFVTLTAPSFGAVHSGSGHSGGGSSARGDIGGTSGGTGRICHRGRPSRCPHGVSRACGRTHDASDPLLGQPLCPQCFDYRGAVLWNAHVSGLWNRTTIRLLRTLGRMGDIGPDGLRLSYVKAAEFQQRGLVHLHVVLRADGHEGPESPPPPWLSTGALIAALGEVVPHVTTSVRGLDGSAPSQTHWGAQMVATELVAGTVDDDAHMAVAAYVAKYATKTADSTGALAYRIRRGSEITRLPVNEHQRRLVETAWTLGGRKELAELRLRRCAHAFGYRGHVVTKSTRYSTTFSALRAVRADYQRARDEHGPGPDDEVHYGFAGRGYDDPGLGVLAFNLARLATAAGEEPVENAGEGGTGDG